ncbi:unnamed protein product [Ilex paraguariensis]|uniref:Nuclear pore complex protein n=1 Tax=Ilex paraguariensis TaxID=185542 RepID=A0ABC8TEH6_9AQUA
MGSSTPFGAPSQPTFVASSTPAFGSSSSSAFGGTSAPAFGATNTPAFASTATPAFGATSTTFSVSSSPVFGSSTPTFGASSTSVFGSSSTPAFGASSTPAFGASTTSAFGGTSAPAFGATNTPAFGSTATPAFGATSTTFSESSSPVFGSSTPAFGASSTSVFGSSSTPAFGASSTPAFGASTTSAFGGLSTPSFSFGSTPAFGQSTSAFGSSPFGTTTSPFGAQSAPFGAQATTPTYGSSGFGQSAFGGHRGGSRVAPYTPTPELDSGTGTQPAGKLESIAAMPVYKDKSHEELRWEDYQLGDKGGPSPAGQSAGAIGFSASSTQSSPFASFSTFGQISVNPFSSSISSNPFAVMPHNLGVRHRGGSRVAPYTPTPELDSTTVTQPAGKLVSIAAMPVYKDKIHEELRWEDYKLGDKGPSPAGQSAGAIGFSASSTQSSPFASSATFGFGQSTFGGHRGGSRVAPYTPTPELDSTTVTQPAGKLVSIAAMPVYKDKIHEELRWEDYKLGDKGALLNVCRNLELIHTSLPAMLNNIFNLISGGPKTPAFGSSGLGSTSTLAFGSSPFGTSSTSNPFGSTSSATLSIFGSTPVFGASTSPSPFGSSRLSAFGSSTSVFGSSSVQGTTPSFGSGLSFGNTQSSPLFQSSAPSLGLATPAFGQTTSSFGQSTPAFGQSSIFSTPSTAFGGNLFSSTPSLLSTSNPSGFGQTTES